MKADLVREKSDMSKGENLKEAYVMWLVIATTVVYVAYMKYFFPRGLADLPIFINFVAALTPLIPLLGKLKLNDPAYSNFWGLFYSLLICAMPIYWLIGFLEAELFLLKKKRYKTYLEKFSNIRIFLSWLLFSLVLIDEFFYPTRLGFINHPDAAFIGLLLSSLLYALWLYSSGRATSVMFQIFKRSTKGR